MDMDFEFAPPEPLRSPGYRPRLDHWLRTGFRAVLVASNCPLFQIWEVYYHLPDHIREQEATPDGLELSRHLRAAGFTRVKRVRVSDTKRVTIWTAAHGDTYKAWPGKALADKARQAPFNRSTDAGDRRLAAGLCHERRATS